MQKLVVIDSCMRGESRTRKILNAAIEALSTRYEIEVIDVNSLSLPPVNPKILAERNGGYVPEETVQLSRKIADADRLVIAAPYWDMSFPAALKAFLENVSLYHITFDDDGTRCVGLCRCMRVLYITTRGMNIRTGDPLEQGSSYIKALSYLWGLGEVLTVSAENLDYSTPEEIDRKINAAIEEIRAISKTF